MEMILPDVISQAQQQQRNYHFRDPCVPQQFWFMALAPIPQTP
jgi:hypothetical protein